MGDLDAWCNYGFRLLAEMGDAHPDFLPVLRRLKVLCDRRVSDLRFGRL